jgi:TonB family protein
MKKACIAFSLCVASCLGVAEAECTRPDAPLPIPAGSSATRDEMLDAMHRLRAYNGSMNVYFNCLEGETDQLEVGAGVNALQEAQSRHAEAHNAAVSELVGITNCFNDQLRVFRESGGGAGGGEADCTVQIDAAKAGADPNSPVAMVPVVDTQPVVARVATGEWSYFLRRGGQLVPCDGRARAECEMSQLIIRNDSEESLHCDVGLSYPQQLEISGRAAVRPRSERVALREAGRPEEPPSEFRVECTGVPAVPELTRPDECNFKITKPVVLGEYYPEGSGRLHREGQAMVEFTLESGEGNATSVEVAESSLYDDLDAAAVEAIRDMTFSADCSGHRHRLQINFVLSND